MKIEMIKVARGGKEIGEYDASEVMVLIKSGKLCYTDHFWNDEVKQWALLIFFAPTCVGKKTKKKSNAQKIEPTGEQEAILRHLVARGEIMLINAYAGSGKTETLRMIAERHPDVKFTYLCYNKDTADKAKKRFPGNATCRTIHSLAFTAVGRYYDKEFRMPSAKEVMIRFGIDRPFIAVLALEAIASYCNSDLDEISSSHFAGKEGNGFNVLKKYPDLLKLAESIWSEMVEKSSAFPISHDAYLKLWSMRSPNLPGDVILHDESQDMNPVVLRILREQSLKKNQGLVIVGDSNQAIYGWRGAVNSMELLKQMADKRYTLTTSFRYGQSIADNASRVLRLLKNEDVRLVGAGPTTASIPRIAYLARKNSSLISMAIRKMKERPEIKFNFSGTRMEAKWDPYFLYEFQKPLDLLSLYLGRPDLVVLEQMKVFESYEEVSALIKGDAEGDGIDRELSWHIKNLVEPYKEELPGLIQELRLRSVSPDAADLSLSTAHRAKGLEWRHVVMIDDFVDPAEVGKCLPNSQEEQEEVNAIYVAMTRASETIEYGATLRHWLDSKETER